MWWVVLGVHVDVHEDWVMLHVGGCNVQCTCYTEHGRYSLSCLYAEAQVLEQQDVEQFHEQCMLGLYGMYGVWSVQVML